MNATQVNLEDYLNAARRRLPLVLLIVVPVVLAVAAYSLMQPDVYRSTAEFRIDLEGPAHDRLQPVTLTNYADQYIGSLRQKALSRDSLEDWIDEVKTYPGLAIDDPDTTLHGLVRDGTVVTMVTTEVTEPGSARKVRLITGFRVGFESVNPATAEKIAQRLAQEFLEEDRATRTERAAATTQFLEQQIALKREEMSELENKLAIFKEENKGALPDTMQLNMGVIERIERDLDSVQAELRTLEQDRIFRTAQLQQIVQQSASATQLAELEQEYRRMVSVYGPDHPDLIRVKRQIEALTTGTSVSGETSELARLEAELAAVEQRYSDQHPDVLRLKRRIESLRNEQRSASSTSSQGDPVYLQLRAQINAIDSRMEGLRARSRELRARLIETEDRLTRSPQVEREFQALMRDLDSARETFGNLQERLATARQTAALEAGERGARITLIQQPYIPDEPAGPPRLAWILFALMFALALGGMIAIAVEAIDTKVRGSKDILNIFEAPPLAVIPMVQNSVSRAAIRRKLILFGGVLIVATAAAVSFLKIQL